MAWRQLLDCHTYNQLSHHNLDLAKHYFHNMFGSQSLSLSTKVRDQTVDWFFFNQGTRCSRATAQSDADDNHLIITVHSHICTVLPYLAQLAAAIVASHPDTSSLGMRQCTTTCDHGLPVTLVHVCTDKTQQ